MDCNKCENKNICKFRNNADEVQQAIKNIKVETFAPFKIDFQCKSYRKENASSTLFNNIHNNSFTR